MVNESSGAGEYEIRLSTPSGDTCQTWAAAQLSGLPGGIADDPDLDGRPNLQEFLLDSSPVQPAVPALPSLNVLAGSPLALLIALPSTWDRPVHALLQSSLDLSSGNWSTIATKSPGTTYWTSNGSAIIQANPSGGYTFPLPPGSRVFYRLAFSLG